MSGEQILKLVGHLEQLFVFRREFVEPEHEVVLVFEHEIMEVAFDFDVESVDLLVELLLLGGTVCVHVSEADV